MRRSAFVTDFDGTITERDIYLLIAERFMPPGLPDYLEDWRQGRRTHFEAMQGYFDHAPTDPASLETLLQDTDFDPRFGDAVRQLNDAGWDLIVVSAGSTWYIERLIERTGVSAVIHANPGTIVEGKGLVTRLPRESPFFSQEVGIDKAAVMRNAIERYERVAFAGDGPPDLPPALLAEPALRFARGWLANALLERGASFHTFQRWSDAVARLLH